MKTESGVFPFTQRRPATEHRGQTRQRDFAIAVLAHELRGPLTAIVNAVTVLRHKGADPEAVEWACGMVERQTRSIGAHIEDLLDVSRVAEGKFQLRMKQVALNTIVWNAVETAHPLIESRGHRLEVTFPSGDIWLHADPDRIEQVIVNLLTNAAKYTEQGGHIRVQLERKQGEAVLRVQDTGIGIEPAFLPHLFDLFAQASDGSRGGLGIGLYLSRELVRLHGGTITACSPGVGKGSEFTVRLPLLRQCEP